jgi:imidazolonepropionase-like amidohydrolase
LKAPSSQRTRPTLRCVNLPARGLVHTVANQKHATAATGAIMRGAGKGFGMLVLVATALGLVAPAVAAAEKIIAIRAGKLVDVVNGKTLVDQVIVIEGERIKALGAAASTPVAAGAEIIDLSRATVLPGLIDAHVHLTGNPLLHGYNSLGVSAMRSALYGARSARITLEAGFTSVRNVGARAFGDVALRDAINDGDIPGPRMLVSGYALGIKGGHCDGNLLPADYEYTARGVADGPWAARSKVREMVKYGADLIKICASGGVLSKGDEPGAQQYTLEEMTAIVEEAHKLGRKVAAHAHGTSSIRDAILAGVDSIEHASLIDAEGIKLAREKGTWLSMDIYNDDYILQEGEKAGMLPESLRKEKEIGQLQRDNFRKALQGGARMVFGSDSGVYPHGDNAKQFFYMVKYGMSNMQAIQAATINAADLMGWKDKVGSLAIGKFADIIAVDDDPAQDATRLTNIKFVMKGGTVVKSAAR